MEQTLLNAHQQIDRLVTALAGPNGGERDRRRVRLILGVAALVSANIWLGAVIGHGLAALVGLAAYFLLTMASGPRTREDRT